MHPLSQFHYCPKCGSPHFETFDARAKRCDACGFTYYLNSSCAVAAVLLDEEQRLLTGIRRFEPAKGSQDLPGGFVEPGETAEEAVKRELKEELGAKVFVKKLLFTLPNEYIYSGFTVPTTDLFFLCELPKGVSLKAGDDISALQWQSLSLIRSENFGLQSIRRGIEKLKEIVL